MTSGAFDINDSQVGTTSLILPRCRCSCLPIEWEELRSISTKVQQDLDDSGMIEPHHEFESVYAMWQAELGGISSEMRNVEVELRAEIGEESPQELVWYAHAHKYWDDEKNCPLSENGVLGGFAHISEIDINCGAGIGRVSKLLLLPMFNHVDLVDQSPRLLRGLEQYLGADEILLARVRNLYCMGLQDFEPTSASYDLIWMQWVLVHLTDLDLVRYLKRCKKALTPNGFIVVKENIFQSAEPYDIDRQDSSITRSAVYYRSIFKQAGLVVLAEWRQRHFPKELYPVKMFALA
ncbi:n-terminal xaa-pro-lys n-methyltransferase 1 isoform x1 [Plasmopara halstedii]|uniref:Alpha N-terminal protein methyltransferase 1 n=1 Tax=Plasmopara halstedii TaxID=4781 RepID=A0A0P1A8S9_PLAHL|nr:n-terminal xaa-pro-lys n-methyltransferase 1 isoform x1 [Plasmopara halstedii]CEG36760.1 n-terminal xaa-pro-lys n-methyltransferase 1 isoform x1 [Plasmopara halstedii]|eukprot:XP_024573129.1 n-terminal xaa-pro-lys n-methyltransferase 1 isoform x1 [Plasmopara halstedii]